MTRILTFERDGVNVTISSAEMEKTVDFKRGKNATTFLCTQCGATIKIPDNALPYEFSRASRGDPWDRVQRYGPFAEEAAKLGRSKSDFVEYLVRFSETVEKHLRVSGRIIPVQRSAGCVIEEQCECGERHQINVNIETTVDFNVPAVYYREPDEIVKASFAKLNDVIIYENDSLEIKGDLFRGEELLNILADHPISFQKHKKLAKAIDWGREDSPEQFVQRIQDYEREIKEIDAVAERLQKCIGSELERLSTDTAKLWLADIETAARLGASKVKKTINRLLCLNLAWLEKELARAHRQLKT